MQNGEQWVKRMIQDEKNNEMIADKYMDEARKALADNRLKDAIQLGENASYLYKKNGNYLAYTFSINLLGVIHASMGNENASIDYYLDALELALRYGYSQTLALIYNNIGTRYQQLRQNGKAIEYFQRAVDMLKKPECMKEKRYEIWKQASYLNLAKAYIEERMYGLAEDKIKEEKKQVADWSNPYYYSYLVLECRLYWNVGKKEEVYQRIGDILEYAEKTENVSDYEEDMKDICNLFRNMKEYENWKYVITCFEKRVSKMDNIHFQLLLTESWMDYCLETGNRERYVELCVQHADLYHKQKKETDQERAAAIDVKIALREKELERKSAEKRSHIDALTGLGNRYLLEKDIKNLLSKKQNRDITIGVLDIDYFKEHNDTYGHIEGDRCLRSVASIIEAATKDIGHAYRFGGDEFVILMETGDEKQVAQIAERIKTKIKEATEMNEVIAKEKKTTLSQGYAVIGVEQAVDEKKLIDIADKALYYVKKHGKNGYHIIKGQEFGS